MDKIFEQRFHQRKYADGTHKKHVKIYSTFSVMKDTRPDDTETHQNSHISRQMDFWSPRR